MNEKEKMLNGCFYNAEDTSLKNDRIKVKDLCFKYNSLPSSMEKERTKLIKQILGKTGEKICIESNFFCDYGYNIEVGENFYINHNCVILDCAKITFGDNVFIGPNCCITTAEHAIDPEMRKAGVEIAMPVVIGNNVWIGAGSTILAGVEIGDNSVIGAGSVVTKSIPSNVVAVGVPCKVLREITEKDKTTYPIYNGLKLK